MKLTRNSLYVLLDSWEHERGQLETLSATSDNVRKTLANLLVLLHDKGVLTKIEVEDIITVAKETLKEDNHD